MLKSNVGKLITYRHFEYRLDTLH